MTHPQWFGSGHKQVWQCLVAMLALFSGAAGGGERTEVQALESEAGRAPRAAARARLDPETGELISEPVTIEWREPSPKLREMLSRRSDDLHQVPLAAGGFMVDLQGRFHTMVMARVEKDGSVQMECLTGAPQRPPASQPPQAGPAPGRHPIAGAEEMSDE